MSITDQINEITPSKGEQPASADWSGHSPSLWSDIKEHLPSWQTAAEIGAGVLLPMILHIRTQNFSSMLRGTESASTLKESPIAINGLGRITNTEARVTLSTGPIDQIPAPSVVAHTNDLSTLQADAEKAWASKDWGAVKNIYGSLVDATADNRELYWPHYNGVARLAYAQYKLGELGDAELGFRRLLSMIDLPTRTRGRVYGMYGELLEQTDRQSRAGILRAHSIGILTDVPDLSNLKVPLLVSDTYKPSERAIAQAELFNEKWRIREPLQRTFVDTDGQTHYTVIDRDADPALRAVSEHLVSKLGPLKEKPAELSTALTEYTGKVFNKNLEPNIEKSYEAYRKANEGKEFFLGEFLRIGIGVCNQRALFMKTMLDEFGQPASLYRGYYLGNGDLHDFTTATISGTERVYDAGLGITGERFSRHIGKTYSSSWDGTEGWG